MAKNTYYFPHDYNARGDEKLVKLRVKMGWQGVGLYWAIIEKLHENGGLLNKDYELIAFDLQADIEIIKNLVENYELFKINDKNFENIRVKNNLKNQKEKSKKALIGAKVRWNKDNANALRTHCERNAIKESKESKESKEKKGEERKENISLQELLKSFVGQYTQPLLEDFENYWNEKDLKGTPRWNKEKTWETERRLKNWKKNQEKWDKKNNKPEEISARRILV